MMRTALLLSSLFVGACTVGEIPNKNPGTPGVDAGSGSNMIDGGGVVGNGCVDRLLPAGDAHVHSAGAGGGTNAGMDCTTATGCHNPAGLGNGAPAFQFGGTAYKTGGTVPTVGAAIVLKGGGKMITVYTDKAGNFSVMNDGTLANPFNGNVSVSGCPTISSMAGTVTQNSCNGTACHTGSAGKIVLADQ